MSRRVYWFGFVQLTIRQYFCGNLNNDTLQSKMAIEAIEKAIETIRKKPDGCNRVQAILLFYKKYSSYTMYGLADKFGVSWRTIQRWNSDFVYEVATNLGYRRKVA